MPHEQISVKVNAKVDRGIAPLVSAINTAPGVVTLDSCEGRDDPDAGPWDWAYVAFDTGGTWQDTGEFVRRLSARLRADKRLADAAYSLTLEWYAGGENPVGYVRVPRRHVMPLADAIASAVETTDPAYDRVP